MFIFYYCTYRNKNRAITLFKSMIYALINFEYNGTI